MTPEQFWSRVDQSGGPLACWPWSGAVAGNGYGFARIDMAGERRSRGAHVIALYLVKGQLSGHGSGLVARHGCDNPICCNPDHLSLGTVRDNSRDASERGLLKGGSALGEANGYSKLTADQVREIRSRYRYRKCGAEKLAAEFNVTSSAIYSVIHRQTWAHLDPPAVEQAA
jgi:hypothetical protein